MYTCSFLIGGLEYEFLLTSPFRVKGNTKTKDYEFLFEIRTGSPPPSFVFVFDGDGRGVHLFKFAQNKRLLQNIVIGCTTFVSASAEVARILVQIRRPTMTTKWFVESRSLTRSRDKVSLQGKRFLTPTGCLFVPSLI